MIRFIHVVCLLFAVQSTSFACDACGCSIMGHPAGLLTEYRKSFLSLGYSHSGFTAAPGIGEGSIDAFHTIDLSFQYFLTHRWSAGIYQPFRINTRTIDQSIQSVSGLADTRLHVKYTFFEQNDDSKPLEIYLDIGAGLILPTGSYDPHLHDQDLPENFNPGNGSLGMSLQQTSALSYRSTGLILKNSLTRFSKTAADYQYGAQWACNLLMFVDIPLDSITSLVPMAGLQFENVGTDLHPNGTEVHGTGGNGIFVSAGCQLKIKNWLCTFQYFIPASHEYSGGEVNARPRINCQLTHLF